MPGPILRRQLKMRDYVPIVLHAGDVIWLFFIQSYLHALPILDITTSPGCAELLRIMLLFRTSRRYRGGHADSLLNILGYTDGCALLTHFLLVMMQCRCDRSKRHGTGI